MAGERREGEETDIQQNKGREKNQSLSRHPTYGVKRTEERTWNIRGGGGRGGEKGKRGKSAHRGGGDETFKREKIILEIISKGGESKHLGDTFLQCIVTLHNIR